jgi:hypothetical protein
MHAWNIWYNIKIKKEDPIPLGEKDEKENFCFNRLGVGPVGLRPAFFP